MPVFVVRLTGYIKRTDGAFVCYCKELDIATSASTLDEINRRMTDMISGYFEACKKAGIYEQEIGRLTGQPPPTRKPRITIETDFGIQQELTI